MRTFCILFITLLFACSCTAQNDLLILKKNNRNVTSFFPGSEMNFSTSTRSYDAYVTSIEKDSVFLVQYDVRRMYTRLGVFILDTVAQYHFGINYRDIISFGENTKNFDWSSSGAGLF